MGAPDTSFVHLLVKRGAKLEHGNYLLSRRIAYTMYDENPEYREFFKRYKLDPSIRGTDGRTLLHSAVQTHNGKLVNELIKSGADVNAVDTSGDTPLHFINTFGTNYPWCGNSYDEDWSDVILYDPYTGRTEKRLMVQSERCDSLSARITRLLMDAGADPDIVGDRNETPLERAMPSWNLTAIRYMIEAGAEIRPDTSQHNRTLLEELLMVGERARPTIKVLLKRYPASELHRTLERLVKERKVVRVRMLLDLGAKPGPALKEEIEAMMR
jgi:ankyrin repeat protein